MHNNQIIYFPRAVMLGALFFLLGFAVQSIAQDDIALEEKLIASETSDPADSGDELLTEETATGSKNIYLVVARPKPSGKGTSKEMSWIAPFVHEYLCFRLSAVSGITVVDPDTILRSVSGHLSYDQPAPSQSAYLSKMETTHTTHLLMTEFKLQKNNTEIEFSQKVVPTSDQSNVISIKSTPCGLEKPGECLDAGIKQLISGLSIDLPAHVKKFLDTRIAGSGKCDNSIGVSMLEASSSTDQKTHKRIAEELKKCSSKEEHALLSYYLSAKEYAKAGEFESAATILKDLIFKLGPTHAGLYPLCARYFRKAEKLENGYQIIKVCEGLKLITNDLVLEKALLLEAMEEDDDAAAAYREVLKFDPANYHALSFLMIKANNDDDATAAIEYANRFRELYPDDGRGDMEAGKAYLAVQQYPEAQKALTKAADILTADAQPRILLGDVHVQGYDYTSALDQYERALELAPENVDLFVKIARTCMLMGKPEMAVETLKKIQKKHYDNPGLQKTLGLAEYQTGDTVTARKDLIRYLRIGAPDREVLFVLGEIYDHAAEYAEALDSYEKAAALDKNDQTVQQRIASVKQKMEGGDYADKVRKKKERRDAALQRSTVSPRVVIRIGSAIACIGAAGAGYAMDWLMKKDYNIYKDYDNNPEAQNTENVANLRKQIDDKILYRNVLYAVAGLSGVGVTITFVLP
ncbi:MAG: tetratricopeptide repeat protein [Chitinispirillaceae bacterium]|nr:tetratricopeptide repeat protein [Chitinispirillaceae bacterium]